MFKSFFTLLVLSAFFLAPTCLKAQSALDKAVPALEKWSSTNPQEKVYLHTDRPYYIAGDTLWFKVYTVIGSRHKLSAWSETVYVDLISETDSILKRLKLPLLSGMAKGNLDLSEDLKSGNYRLRAYTNWMRNAPSEYFFERTFKIGQLSQQNALAKADFKYTRGKGNETTLNSVISYRDVSGAPLAQKAVSYKYYRGDALLRSGKAKTDQSGTLSLEIKTEESNTLGSSYLLCSIETSDKKWQENIFSLKSNLTEPDVQFMPEGGNLVAGIDSRVSFKAIGTDGLGTSVSGDVLDQNGNQLVSFSTSHAGMGVFNLLPETGNSYKARVKFKDGSTKDIPLPEVKPSGYAMSVFTPIQGDMLVRVFATPDYFRPASLLVHSGGEVLFAADLSINRALNNVRVPMKNFPPGIAQVTLFDNQGRAVNERAVFVYPPDSLNISLSPAKKISSPREEVAISLSATDINGKGLVGNFSMSVTDETKVPVKEEEESTIFSELLLRSDLKGYVEQPNYYFTKVTDSVAEKLDLLMMTQGFSRYNWDSVFVAKTKEPVHKREKLVSSIKGKLLTLTGKPVVNGKVTVFSVQANVALETTTDEEGKFLFDSLLIQEGVKFTVQGRSAKNSDRVEIIVDWIPEQKMTLNKNRQDLALHVDTEIDKYLQSTRNDEKALETKGLASRNIGLDEVKITARRTSNTPVSWNLNGPGHADQIISSTALGPCPTLRQCLEGLLAGVRFEQSQSAIGPVFFPVTTRGSAAEDKKMLVVVDGRKLDPNDGAGANGIAEIFEQNILDPADIYSIEVLRSPSYTNVYGREAGNGVILINTRGYTPGMKKDFSAKTYNPRGFSNVREFYSPKYGVSPQIDAKADVRSTIYWNPAISTRQDGTASLRFFNAGTPGSYRIVLEGIDINGNLIRNVSRYQVK